MAISDRIPNSKATVGATRRISDITVGVRHRRDLGDMEGLAAPIVITPGNVLIAGERRLAACAFLLWREVPLTVVDLDKVVKGEFAENSDLTLSEAVAIKRAIEPIERAEAKARQAAADPASGRGKKNGTNSGKLPTPVRGRAARQRQEGNGQDASHARQGRGDRRRRRGCTALTRQALNARVIAAMIDLPTKGKRPRWSHIFDRDADDFYVEPAWCSECLFAVDPFAGLIWDPAAGSGTIPRAARAAGLSNFASDIAEHGCGPRQDFLIASAPAEAFDVVTNPPFRWARAFVEQALTLGARKTAVIFPTARLNAARWLEPLPLTKIYLLTPRDHPCRPERSSPVESGRLVVEWISRGWFSITVTAGHQNCDGCIATGAAHDRA